jgi:hypothetical protein
MTWPNFSKFSFDFSIVPDLLCKRNVQTIFDQVLPSHSSTRGKQRHDGEKDFEERKNSPEGMSFSGFMVCLSEIALGSCLCGEESEGEEVFSLLQWMERSKGKKIMSQSRTSMLVEPFRSTVQRSPTKQRTK